MTNLYRDIATLLLDGETMTKSTASSVRFDERTRQQIGEIIDAKQGLSMRRVLEIAVEELWERTCRKTTKHTPTKGQQP